MPETNNLSHILKCGNVDVVSKSACAIDLKKKKKMECVPKSSKTAAIWQVRMKSLKGPKWPPCICWRRKWPAYATFFRFSCVRLSSGDFYIKVRKQVGCGPGQLPVKIFYPTRLRPSK